MVDVLLINPTQGKRIYQGLTEFAAIENPVWTGLIAEHVAHHGFTVEVLDANAEGLSPEATVELIDVVQPFLICFVAYGHNPSASTQTLPFIQDVCELMDRKYATLLVGGHVAAMPFETLKQIKADYACKGEGPKTIVGLLRAMREGGFEHVPDLVWNGKVNPTAGLIVNLDEEMPTQAFDLLPMSSYRAHNWHAFGYDSRQPYASIYTSLGCPFNCSYCVINAPFKADGKKTNRYRMWSPKMVLSQIETLVEEYGVKHLKIADEIFLLNRRHVEGLCNGIIERGWDLNTWAYARVDFAYDRDMLDLLRKAGIRWLCLGYESGNARVRESVNKEFKNEKAVEATKLIHDAGLHVIANFMFGFPEDDSESMQDTLDLALELNCEFANFYCVAAYPGSALYGEAVEKKWPLPKEWSGYAQLAPDMTPLPTNHVEGLDVLRFRDQAFKSYFSNPAYQTMLLRKFGQSAVDHVNQMLGVEIKRN